MDDVLGNLIQNYYTGRMGEWRGAMQKDAVAFAPGVLYGLGEERGDQKLKSLATSTVNCALRRIVGAVLRRRNDGEVMAAAIALYDGYKHTGNFIYKHAFLMMARKAADAIAQSPSPYIDYVFDTAAVYGMVAYFSMLAHEISGNAADIRRAESVIAQADRQTWNESAGLYDWKNTVDWPNAFMTMALAKLYCATGDARHVRRAMNVVEGMNRTAWDNVRGGYFSEGRAQGVKHLSGNNHMVWALLDLYEATGDRRLLARAGRTLEWILSPDLYDARERLIYHHVGTAASRTPGRASYACSGCNFQTLYNLLRYSKLTTPLDRS